MKFLQALISLILLVVTLSLLSYGMTPGEQDMFVGQFDPLNGIMNILYLLIYNIGLPRTVSVAVLIIGMIFVWMGYYWVIGKIFFKRKANRYSSERRRY